MMRSPPLPSTPDLSTELTNTREWADGVVTGMDLVRMKGALLGKSNDAGGYPNQNNFKHSTDGCAMRRTIPTGTVCRMPRQPT